MTQPSFLDRTTFGLRNYFLIALGMTVLLALIPRAARQALHGNTNKAEDWLPATYTESADLRWFREHFISEGFVLVTWDGCTLGNLEKLNLLREKLSTRLKEVEPHSAAAQRGPIRDYTGKWFRKIVSGPSMIEELTSPPLSLTYAEAVRRLEGALVGPPRLDAEGNSFGDDTRTTCLLTYLTWEGYETNRAMRRVVDEVRRVAIEECGVPEESLHMGGPICDNVAIDRAGEGTLLRLAGLSGVVGLVICYWCFRNLPLTTVVVAVGGVSATLSIALVYYYGVVEVLVGGLAAQKYGKMDAVLMSMPAVVYILGLSGAIHLVNYYRDTRAARGLKGAAERAVRLASTPCILAALTTAVGLGSLVVSDIVPIKKFGGFTGVAVMTTLVVLFTLLPIFLHRFPPKRIGRRRWDQISGDTTNLPPWAATFSRFLADRHNLVIGICTAVMILCGIGLTRIESTVQLLKLLDSENRLIQDYAWIEENMANLVPMEVVITVPPERCRTGEENAEQNGKQYTMTMLERLEMIERIVARVESLDAVSRTLSVSTFAPEESKSTSETIRRGNEFTVNKTLEEKRDAYADYLQLEVEQGGKITGHSRELWRISARVTALKDIDYGHFTDDLRTEVEPVLTAYRQRDLLVKELHDAGRTLEGAKICVLLTGNPDENRPEAILADVLRKSSGVRARDVESFDLAILNSAELTDEARANIIAKLESQDAVLLVTDASRDAADQLTRNGIMLFDVAQPIVPEHSAAIASNVELGPRTLRSVYTGIIPLVFKTQRQLLVSLRQSIAWATVLIAGVMAIVFRSALAGIVAMLPNVFPIFLVFGTLGWLGVKIDIGIMMTASVALGVAVDNTVHLVTWFRDAQRRGHDRRTAVLMAYERCATAMVQTALVGGMGLVVFAFSTFTPTQQFGYLMITILCAALIGDLVMLPALLCSPLGKCFECAATPPGRDAGTSGPVDAVSKYGAEARAEDKENGATLRSGVGTATSTVRNDPPLVSPANAALHAKLRAFRRTAPKD
jgi:predicted RND superfamily exporter protein